MFHQSKVIQIYFLVLVHLYLIHALRVESATIHTKPSCIMRVFIVMLQSRNCYSSKKVLTAFCQFHSKIVLCGHCLSGTERFFYEIEIPSIILMVKVRPGPSEIPTSASDNGCTVCRSRRSSKRVSAVFVKAPQTVQWLLESVPSVHCNQEQPTRFGLVHAQARCPFAVLDVRSRLS